MVTETERFNRITDDGLCIGCGLCQALLSTEKVEVMRAENGELRPHTVTALSKADTDLIYATCPGTRCEANSPELRNAAPHHDLVWGAYHRLVLGHASDSKTRYEGSTGGVLTALACYLLDSNRVSFILHVKPSVAEPSFGEATLSFSKADVMAAVGSRYGPTAPLIDLESVLQRNEPFAVIAKPCDLNALQNLSHHDERINSLIKYKLAPVCGGFMPDESMTQTLQRLNIEREDVSAVRYRGRGCPGPTAITGKNNQRHEFDYIDFWGEDESMWSLPFRCKICPDGIGEAADIAVADTWPGGSPKRGVSDSDLGTNSFIIRTDSGMNLIEAAENDGYLSLKKAIDIEYLNRTQPHQVTKKKSAHARYLGLSDAGRLTPTTVGLRLQKLAEANSNKENSKQRLGSFNRAQKFKSKPLS